MADASDPQSPEVTPSLVGILKKLGLTGVVAVICGTLPIAGSVVLFTYIRTVSSYLRSHDFTGMAIYFIATVFLAGLAMMPTYSVSALAGWAFGVKVGAPLAVVSFTAAAMFAYAIGRLVSGQRAIDVIDSQPKWKAVHRSLLGGSWLKTLGLVTLIRLPPNSPFAVTNLVLSSLRVRPTAYLLGTFIGMAPRTAAVATLGALGGQTFEAPPENRWFYLVGLGVSVAVVAAIFFIVSRELAKVTKRVMDESAKAGDPSEV